MLLKLFRFFSSLKLAVLVLSGLAISLAVATFVESLTDIATGRYWVYRSSWFYGILTLLGINIFAVAVSRYPWKRKHTPFLMAHLGILMVLSGSFVTFRWGLDGSLVLREGERSALLEMDELAIYLSREAGTVEKWKIPWRPPGVSFSPMVLGASGLEVVSWLTHAEPKVQFEASQSGYAAIQLEMTGGPMDAHEKIWLWGGDPSWSDTTMGPVQIRLMDKVNSKLATSAVTKPELRVTVAKDGRLELEALSPKGPSVKKQYSTTNAEGAQMETPWMKATGKPFRVAILRYFPHALNTTAYVASRIKYGDQAPESAVELQKADGKRFWLGLGQRATVLLNAETPSSEVAQIGYMRERRILPFEVELKRFQLDHYEGSNQPSSYASHVEVFGPDTLPKGEVEISMNTPLEAMGYTLYQSSYVPEMPRPTTSILSVNQDPGRPLKYWGSILIVLGAFLLFAVKTWKQCRWLDFLRGN